MGKIPYETDKPIIAALLKREGITAEEVEGYKKVVDVLREDKITRTDILQYEKVISILKEWYLKPSFERDDLERQFAEQNVNDG